MVTDAALYPWEDIDMLVREQAEADIWADAEHDAWLAALMADQQAALDGGDPCYERWVEAGAPGVVWSSLDDDDTAYSLSDEPGYSESIQPYLW